MKRLNKKNITAIVLLIGLATAFYYCYYNGLFENYSAEGIKEHIDSLGIFGPIIYMILFSVIPSGSIIAIAGGMAFGIYLGTLYTILGALLGATTAFYIARFLGRESVEKLLRGKFQSIGDGAKKNGFLFILILRLIPVIPFNIISYGAGLTKINYKDYLLATMIGIIPGVIVFTNLGDKALNINSPEFILAVAMFLGLIIISLLLKKRVPITRFTQDK